MRIKLILSLALALICLYFAFRGISFSHLWAAICIAKGRWIALAFFIYTFGWLFRTWRWQILMRPIQVIPVLSLMGPLILGFFANNILPFRIGELVRAHITGKKFRISRTASLGTILLERLCDMIAFLSTFVGAAFFFTFPPAAERAAAIMALACISLVIALLLGIRFQTHLHGWINQLPAPPHWKTTLQEVAENFIQGVSGMHEMAYVIAAIGLSLIIWLIEGTTLFLIVRAFPVAFNWPQAFFLLFFMGLSVTLPQAPGYVGTMELLGVMALQWLGISKDQGLPIILTIHATQFLYIAALGCGALWHEGLSITELKGNALE